MSEPPEQSQAAKDEPPILSYRNPVTKPPKNSNGWQIAGGFGIYQAAIWLRVFTFPNYVPLWQSLTQWLVLTVILIAGSIGVGIRWNKWGYFKGILAAFLLTGSCCGLLSSICGNPFRPIL